jgi:16S rRNA (guanine527-N7)-methyltransferase
MVCVSRETKELLQALTRRFGLDGAQYRQLEALLVVLDTDDLAPTTVAVPERAVQAHIADSLVGLEMDALRRAARIADIGAGAGFPGLPLAVACPESEVTLVESQTRKCAFVEQAIGVARIQNASVVCARAEAWPEGLRSHECVVARAVGPQPVVLEYSAPLLVIGGSLMDWRGSRNPADESAALAAAEELGMERVEIRHVQPFPGARDLHLHAFVKRQETPSRFPRRAGMARKRPLAGPSARRGPIA